MSFSDHLALLRAGSRFATRALEAQPVLEEELRQSGHAPFTVEAMQAALADALSDASGEQLGSALRKLRLSLMLRLIYRDLNGLASLDEVMRSISDFAEVAVASAVRVHHQRLAERHGAPMSAGEPLPLWVVGMGKLGGHELNVSSDIDLIFVYPEDGETTGNSEGRFAISFHEFYARLGKAVIQTIDERTHEGQVFRVDMRLRPFGDSGPLVASLDSLEHYFLTSARPWERYAWLKGRVLGASAPALDDLVRPFVYRKYHDYGMIQDLRELHSQIRAEANRKNRQDDIKVGAGGIREVEFIAQLQQLIRGGRERSLQTRSTRIALERLGELNLLDAATVARLQAAYEFLRRLEHRLQYVDDAQTQALPQADEDRQRIAATMGFNDWPTFLAALDQHRIFVAESFNALFAAEAGERAQGLSERLWQQSVEAPEDCQRLLGEAGFSADEASELTQRLAAWRQSARFRFLTERARNKLEKLIPLALTAAHKETPALPTALRLLELLEAVDRRDAYLSLMIENPAVLSRAARLAARSAWAAGLLQRHPILLDELVRPRVPAARVDWVAERRWLEQELHAAADDTERHFEILRHFKQVHTLRLNIADVDGTLEVMALADELSALADLLLDVALGLVWRAIKPRDDAGFAPPPGFIIVGYGKLGSKELGYASDLDLVFLRDDSITDAPDGQTAHRIAQRLNQLLTAQTTGGALYDTDLRLRPDGAAGMMVSTLESFRTYQLERAWTWEHQALTRARFAAGDVGVAARFEAIRSEILTSTHDAAALHNEVLDMRAKMRAEHPGTPGPDGRSDLKHAAGGIIDLEFIVQWLVLAHAAQHAGLVRNAGNFALLKLAGELGLVQPAQADAAARAYLAFRARQHLARNNNEARTLVTADELRAEREAVQALWASVMGNIKESAAPTN